MRLLAVLQNQWFHDPEKVRAILARTPQARRRLIHYSLFAGCRTGRVLKDVFGEERCRTIVWEEASPEIGGKASSCFPADQAHLRAVLDDVKPDLVLAFGRIAGNALAELVPGAKLILGPHPHRPPTGHDDEAARHGRADRTVPGRRYRRRAHTS
jgi:hypothetical protein